MQIEHDGIALLQTAFRHLKQGFKDLPEFTATMDDTAVSEVLLDVAQRMQDNYPYFHPLYAGQMLKPPHPLAFLAYALAIVINPNNHALDGGRASSGMEKEAVAEIARMMGWDTHLGHLCSGGTVANLEALWIAGQLDPGKKIVASNQAHYTHQRICAVLQLPFDAIACDDHARLEINALKQALEKGDIGTVVVTLGTTATGSVDPLAEILGLREHYHFRVHVDAAYGGFFRLVDSLAPETRAAFERLEDVDSLVVDPHKHGLQPYGCGCVLFKDPVVGKFYRHDSPYTYFSSPDLHLGEISLECSRPGASAVALWATQRLLPYTPGGVFAKNLEKSRRAAVQLFKRLQEDSRFWPIFAPELDIVVWAPKASRASQISALSKSIFDAAASRHLHLALANLPRGLCVHHWKDVDWDQNQVTCLRSCLMKPEHLDWMDRLWQVLSQATDSAFADV
jgi:glutamate/tyrosine decarboxylase-like PLP-dependent enzyme